MALLTPQYMQAASGDTPITYSAQEDRAGLLGTIFSREGVLDLRGGHLKVTQRAAGANFSVDVAPGRCAIFGDDISDEGAYVCSSTTTVNLTIPARPASGSRTHRVVARVRNKLSNGVWTGYDWVIQVLADTGSGTPALPNSAITLALVTVSSTASSVINSMIDDSVRTRASVGTADVMGTFSLRAAYYSPEDVNRPLRYQVNPDGRVLLSGFVRFVRTGGTSHPNYAITAGTQNQMTEFVLPTEMRPANASYRDFVGATSAGPVFYSIMPTGHLTFSSWTAVTHVSGSTWFSFDGCSYQI